MFSWSKAPSHLLFFFNVVYLVDHYSTSVFFCCGSNDIRWQKWIIIISITTNLPWGCWKSFKEHQEMTKWSQSQWDAYVLDFTEHHRLRTSISFNFRAFEGEVFLYRSLNKMCPLGQYDTELHHWKQQFKKTKNRLPLVAVRSCGSAGPL